MSNPKNLIGRTCYAKDPGYPSRKGKGVVMRIYDYPEYGTLVEVYLVQKGTYTFLRKHVRINQSGKQKPLRLVCIKPTGNRGLQKRGTALI